MIVGIKIEDNEEVIKDNYDWEDEDSVVRNLICILVIGIEDSVRDEVSVIFFIFKVYIYFLKFIYIF